MRHVGTDLICNYMASICARDQLYVVLIYDIGLLIFYKGRRAKVAHVMWLGCGSASSFASKVPGFVVMALVIGKSVQT